MITNWSLTNFKSIEGPIDLKFAPLTIVSGANSSGKSSLLQSILLIGQTLGSKIGTPSVQLNGKYFRFGHFADVLFSKADSRNVSIGWSLRVAAAPTESHIVPILAQTTSEFGHVKGAVTFSSDELNASEKLYPSLCDSCIEFVPDLGYATFCSAALSRNCVALTDELLALAELKPAFRKALEFKASFEGLPADFLSDARDGEVAVGCTSRNFLPEKLVVQYDRSRSFAHLEIYMLITAIRRPDYISASVREWRIHVELARKLVSCLQASDKDKTFEAMSSGLGSALVNEQGISFSTFIEIGSKWKEKQRIGFAKLLKSLEDELVEAVCDNLGVNLDLREKILPEAIERAKELTESYFVQSLKYLGPLRDEPRSFYSNFNGDVDSLGFRGEYTAVVLHQHRNDLIRDLDNYPVPPNLDKASDHFLLKELVDAWLQYFGVAEDLLTQDQGRLGHQLLVDSFDLTHVGFGISQLLPILTLGLLSKAGETIVIEQPELHLHPYAQTRLTDFFLALAKSGRQVIIETHSEYLVNRCRTAIAESADGKEQELIKIYFATRLNGTTHFESVDINRYGAIVNWPKGFFDETDENARRLLDAALKKRRSVND